ncbi:hypothetical protein PCANC_10040 [Puccinia coronata f. sp. avenae]|uniref:Uncharacterized protein n=1 Tax=Puccinia coronata f. sp. avenae TaxID=200324 RepID=A0A2N5UZ11_9BASI|nr:hypothetical protein PCANC_10040 [Puccinia coronata f. sp. avenae]
MSDSMNFMKTPALKVMLAIDEARKLIKHKALDENNVEISYFHIFCRVLSQVPSDHHGFSTVFTNTTLSLLANVTPWLVDERSYPFYGLYFKDLFEALPASAIEELMGIAQAKLLCKPFTTCPRGLTRPQILAVLGSIIQTQMSTTSSINSELVSSHAAHCMHINCDRDRIGRQKPTVGFQVKTIIGSPA